MYLFMSNAVSIFQREFFLYYSMRNEETWKKL